MKYQVFFFFSDAVCYNLNGGLRGRDTLSRGEVTLSKLILSQTLILGIPIGAEE